MKFFLFIFFVGFVYQSRACTSAIISGKVTKDGCPLMWKHFDNEQQLNKKVLYLSGGKYSAMAIVNAGYKENKTIWMGHNSEGFAIMSTDSGNLRDSVRVETNMSGVFMKEALLNCASVEEFESFLKNYPKPHGFRVNFGVIDARGNGAYFETNNFTYVCYDVNDSRVAPNGYLIRTNYSLSGLQGKGHGYIRYKTVEKILERHGGKKLDINFLLDSVCLSLENSLSGQKLQDFENVREHEKHYMYFQDCINRYSTGAAAVIQGVKNNEDSGMTTMWTIVGFPLTSVAIPVWLSTSGELPSIITGEGTKKSLLCNFSLQLKKTLIAATYGDMRYYINTAGIKNIEGTGILQRFDPVRKEVFQRGIGLKEKLKNEKGRDERIKMYYVWLDSYLKRKLQEIKELYIR